jgi:uncharacterized protein (TIGR02444 family)
MAIKFEDHPLWDYACALYGRDGVSTALIAMQDRHGLDVNILLLCIWAGRSGRGVLSAAELEHVLAVSSSWNPEIVCGLRGLRIRLRDGAAHVPRDLSDALRKRILAVEIEAEHVEQLALVAGLTGEEDAARPAERRLADCLVNLSRYLAARGCAPADADIADLAAVLAAAFPEIDADTVRSRCEAQFAPGAG